VLRRALGVASRRLDRPELLAAFYPAARQAEHDAIGIGAVLASTLHDDSTYVDVGTNRGQVLREAVRIAPHGQHVAFEPIPSLAAEITAAFPQVDCRPLALGAAPEVTKFCHFRKLDGWSGLRRNAEIGDEQGQPEFIDVRVSTLDAELAERAPAVVKIDVEGAELAVLEGGRSVLAEARPVLIFEHVPRAAEAYGATPEAIWELLSELHYGIFSVTGEGPFTRSAFAQASGAVNWLGTPEHRGTPFA
jgi:FkbM family methyltransferase